MPIKETWRVISAAWGIERIAVEGGFLVEHEGLRLHGSRASACNKVHLVLLRLPLRVELDGVVEVGLEEQVVGDLRAVLIGVSVSVRIRVPSGELVPRQDESVFVERALHSC